MANGTIAFDTLQTSGQIDSRTTGLSLDTDYLVHGTNKVWVNFDGSASSISPSDSLNVTSLTDNGTGDYTVTINNDFSAATYACPISVGSGSGAGRYIGTGKDTERAAGSCIFFTLQSSSGGALDAPDYNISFQGELA